MVFTPRCLVSVYAVYDVHAFRFSSACPCVSTGSAWVCPGSGCSGLSWGVSLPPILTALAFQFLPQEPVRLSFGVRSLPLGLHSVWLLSARGAQRSHACLLDGLAAVRGTLRLSEGSSPLAPGATYREGG